MALDPAARFQRCLDIVCGPAIEGGFVNDPQAIQAAIQAVLDARFPPPEGPVTLIGQRGCTHASCNRPLLANGLCNGHYIRAARGADMDRPFANRDRDRTCSECDAPMGKGAWGLCQKHYRRARLRAIKEALIAIAGGRCAHCRESYPSPVFDFHHQGDKDGSIADMMANGSLAALCREIVKCILLCANCHRMEHFDVAG